MSSRVLSINQSIIVQLLSILLCFNSFSQSKSEPIINGKLQLDSIWEPVVYLSHIPTFNDMFTMSNEMIIAEAKIDTSGYFIFPTEALPNKDNLFRLHVSKKDAPSASLIIGGNEENHIFFIANSRSSVFIDNTGSVGLFDKYILNGYKPNDDLEAINEIIKLSEQSDTVLLKKQFVEKTLNEQLRHIADTSSNAIVSLYALNNSKFETTYLSNQLFYENYLEKWKNEDSTYFRELRTKLPRQEKSSSTFWLIVFGLFFFILGFAINYYFSKRKSKSNNSHLKSLSIQERKIFQLIQLGKSNKEISEEYNIGLSTVKSHVSNIYSKLNIKSRKEAMDIK
ncbi:LuxR C-terminal-related transcriptional regulator [Winogradskyella sp. 3972H.M.0a.05]|uniref:response regulator transcription factor n=1 Tax=Winogradskyella sp. 3972H.M.0a.05 TaxID=2950277 RepID=UPI0033990F3D